MNSKPLSRVKSCFLCFASVWLVVFSSAGYGESYVGANVDSRVVLAFHANAAAIQQLLPTPWRLNPVGKGPMQGTNFFVVFGDRAIAQDPEGKPKAGGITRFVGFVAPATNPDTGQSGTMVFRIFEANSQEIPGPYSNSVLASISRDYTYSGKNMAFGKAEETWSAQVPGQADIRLAIRYQKALPSRAQREFHVYSAVVPSFYRIYRVDQGIDIVKSVPASVDRLLGYDAHIDVPKFKDVFNGTEELVSVAVLPWYVRRVFLP